MKPQNNDADQLHGAIVLLAEDELLLLLELESILRNAGAAEVHLCRNVRDAIVCAETQKLTAAILDIRLGQEFVTPVARVLKKYGTPFMFYTGQTMSDPQFAEWRTHKIVLKPARSTIIIQVLTEIISKRSTLV